MQTQWQWTHRLLGQERVVSLVLRKDLLWLLYQKLSRLTGPIQWLVLQTLEFALFGRCQKVLRVSSMVVDRCLMPWSQHVMWRLYPRFRTFL